MEFLQKKFYSAPIRKADRLIYNKEHINIAVHIRRGDIITSNIKSNENLKIRFQDNSYYLNIVKTLLDVIGQSRKIAFYLFSQGEPNDFADFQQIKEMNFCLDMDPMASFLHMVYADILITSKSSFSYKPALLSKGLKICPENFWHDYPDANNWIIAAENGNFNKSKLISYYE
jgi:hypothetical protein